MVIPLHSLFQMNFSINLECVPPKYSPIGFYTTRSSSSPSPPCSLSSCFFSFLWIMYSLTCIAIMQIKKHWVQPKMWYTFCVIVYPWLGASRTCWSYNHLKSLWKERLMGTAVFSPTKNNYSKRTGHERQQLFLI